MSPKRDSYIQESRTTIKVKITKESSVRRTYGAEGGRFVTAKNLTVGVTGSLIASGIVYLLIYFQK